MPDVQESFTNGPCPNWTFGGHNQVNTSGFTYDAAGNVTNDGTYSYQWDAEGRLTAVTLSGIVVSMNTYNALGQRVEDVTQASTTEEAYGADGALLARYTGETNSRSFVPFKGRLLAEYYCGGVIFDHPDELGTATTATDCTGENVQERLYYPFGEFWNGAGSLGMHQMFAQLPDYDPETDQYNTPSRHYMPMGRWLTPDPLGGDLTNPQSLNRYAYVLNNPTTLTDPLGLIAALCNDPTYAEGDASCGTPPWLPGTGPTGSASSGGGAWAPGWGPPPTALTGTLLAAGQAQAEAQFEADECIGCVQFQGTLYGNYVNTVFDSLDQYFDWRTSEAALPQNQIYDAFWALLENQGGNPSEEYKVQVYWWGLTPNVSGMGPLNTAAAAQGGVADPVHITHTGPSYIGPGLVDTWHCADEGWGGTCHNDNFSPLWLLPLHEIFDYLPSLFINPKSQIPQNTSTWYCSGVGGCHQ